MDTFQIIPSISLYKDFASFARSESLTERDFILTNEYIYRPVISDLGISCKVLFQEKFGRGEPSDTMIDGILRELGETEYERIIAVGGGTIIDIAKVLAVAEKEERVDDLYGRMGELKKVHPLVIIPTTCGTGSEVTNISVVNRTSLGTKQGLVSAGMFADKAALIPEFFSSLPYQVFATSSIDALVHAVESYLNPKATIYSAMYSVKAIEIILKGYCKIAASGREVWQEDAESYLIASNMAGIAFSNNGCGAIHAMAYAIGGKYHVPHGESNYQYFIPVLKCYEKKAPAGKLAELKALLKSCMVQNDFCAADNEKNSLVLLEELLEKVLPMKKMSEYGVVQEDIVPFAQSTVEHQQRLLGNSYVPLSREEIQALYQGCL